MSDRPDTQPSSAAEKLGYEPKDASVRVVAIVVALLVGGIAGSIVVSAWMYQLHYSERSSAGPRQTSFANGSAEKSSIEADREQLDRDVAANLASYGWADADKKHVRIPIERAMELTARDAENTAKEKKP